MQLRWRIDKMDGEQSVSLINEVSRIGDTLEEILKMLRNMWDAMARMG